MKENTNWQHTIKAQAKEIPTLEHLLTSAVNEDDTINLGIDTQKQIALFGNELVQKQTEMTLLTEQIGQQQKRLVKDCALQNEFDLDAFFTQDVLRERIKAIEKAYIELKCNFLNYLSGIS